MKNYAMRITGMFAGAALFASIMAPAAFANTNIEITNNGPGSNNNVTVNQSNNTSVNQTNNTDVTVEALVVSNTGGNKANSNNGDVNISTGNATSNVTVNVTGGTNNATVNPCGCSPNDVNVTLDHNGPNSTNKVKFTGGTNQNVKQKNKTSVGVGVSVISKTGKNKANKNNGGTVDITTKDASSSVNVLVSGSTNTLNPGP